MERIRKADSRQFGIAGRVFCTTLKKSARNRQILTYRWQREERIGPEPETSVFLNGTDGIDPRKRDAAQSSKGSVCNEFETGKVARLLQVGETKYAAGFHGAVVAPFRPER